MIHVCPQCGSSDEDGHMCGMCSETLYGEERIEAVADGCYCRVAALCDDCLPPNAHYINILGERVEF